MVITTNLDRILERIFEKTDRKFQTIYRGGDLYGVSGAFQKQKRILIKLHGDRDDTDWVLTGKQYDAAYGSPELDLTKPLPKLLRLAIEGKTLLFLGCGLQKDRTMTVMREVGRGMDLEHFALLSETENRGERHQDFQRWNIRPIYYPKGEYSKIGEFLACLAGNAAPLAVAATGTSLDSLVMRARAAVADSIRSRCGTMKILDMERAVDLEAIYTDVNVLQKVASHQRKSLEDFQKLQSATDFERFGLASVEVREDGFTAVASRKRLVIYGKPGAGKSTFLKHLAMRCINGRYREGLVPVFISLIEFGQAGLSSLVDYVSREWRAIDWELWTRARLLLLLDGLDEVKDEHFSSVRKAIEAVAAQYPQMCVVITCRNAAREHNFEAFDDVEMADFDQPQIEQFSKKWFEAKQDGDSGKRFLARLEANPKLMDLAAKPLLLTLLCVIFEQGGDLQGSRARLYQEGLHVLLQRWDATRGIDRQNGVPLEDLEWLLDELAFRLFARQDYFFEKEMLRNLLTEISEGRIASRPSVDQLIHIAEAKLGILVQRAKDVYSFSHLTFHEYLAARKLSRDSNTLATVADEFGNTRWRDVWLLVAGQLNPEAFIPQQQAWTAKQVQAVPAIQRLLRWAARKASVVQASARMPARRAFYVSLALARALDRALDLDLALDLYVTLDLGPDRALDRIIRNYQITPAFKTVLQELRANLPDSKDREAWRQWADAFRAAIIQHRDIGHRWDFNAEESNTLNRYLYSNQLLIDCMNESRGLSRATRDRIENEMLLPSGTDI